MKSTGACWRIFFLLIFSLSGFQCKKIKEDIGRKFIINAMTSGLWIVQTFSNENVDITAEFSSYEFQFKKDGKVIAIKTLAPLSTTQELKDAQNTLQFYQMVGAMSPQMLPAVIKPETVIWIGQALGVPVDKLPTSDEFKMAIENMAQAAAQMQQQQQPA